MLPLKPLVTTHGLPVEILDPGVHNTNAGPDFLNAKIRIADTVWVGHVEIHVHARDWYAHQHHLNPAFNMVILHVVLYDDCEVSNALGEKIPQLQITIPPYVVDRYKTLSATQNFPRCYPVLPQISPMIVHNWMNALLVERMCDRQDQILKRLQACDGNWEDCFYATLARSFGFGLNGDSFDSWSSLMSWRAVDKHGDNLFQIEALFLGTAGLLQQPTDHYLQQLQHEYAYLSHKFQLSSLQPHVWKQLRTRPVNFPLFRLAQLAALYHQHRLSLSALLDCKDLKQVRQLFTFTLGDYWKQQLGTQDGLTDKCIDLLIINAVIPALVAYQKHRGGDESVVLEWLEQLKPEQNKYIRLWDACGIHPAHAADSQALIQLKKVYCDNRKCLDCKFGYYYMCKQK